MTEDHELAQQNSLLQEIGIDLVPTQDEIKEFGFKS